MEQLGVPVNMVASGFGFKVRGSPKISAIGNNHRGSCERSQKRLCIKAPLW